MGRVAKFGDHPSQRDREVEEIICSLPEDKYNSAVFVSVREDGSFDHFIHIPGGAGTAKLAELLVALELVRAGLLEGLNG